MVFTVTSNLFKKYKMLILLVFIALTLIISFLCITDLLESNNKKLLNIIARVYFDEKFYLQQYPEVNKSNISPFEHYSTIGWLEGKNPNAKFDNNFYLMLYNTYDVNMNTLNPLQHYVSCKMKFKECFSNKTQLKTAKLLKKPKHYLSLVALFRNEARFLKEWIEFHKLMGVEHFYLFNHLSDDDYMSVLQPYIDDGTVELEQLTDNNFNLDGWHSIQLDAYNKIIDKTKYDTEWLIVFDSDEFLFPVEEKNLPDVLKKYDEYACVSVSWRIFGTSNVEHVGKNELLIETLSKAEAPNNLHVKSIVKPRYVKEFTNPHFPKLLPGYVQVTENYEYFYGPFSPRNSRKILAINHYFHRDLDYLRSIKLNRIHYVNAHLTEKERRDRIKEIFENDKSSSLYEDQTILKFLPELKLKVFPSKK